MTVSAAARDELQPGEARPRILPPPTTSVSNGPSGDMRAFVLTEGDGREPTGVAVVNRTDCAPTKLRARLTTKGLEGGLTARSGDSYRCNVPARVVLRVRARFMRPTRFSADQRFPSGLVAKGRISIAYVSIATTRGKPIALTSVNGVSGKARAFTALNRCMRAK
jgi:hypothetical protein